MNKEENLAPMLTAPSSQVLLFLLARKVQLAEAHGEGAEFAIRPLTLSAWANATGLARRSIVLALTELEQANLIRIVPHGEALGQAPQPDQGRASRPPGVELLWHVEVSHGDELAEAGDLDELCRKADQSEDKLSKIKALQAVWDDAFPSSQYPYQRLSRGAADKWLANGRSVEWLANVIYRAIEHATGPIRTPRAYIERAIAGEEEREARGGDDDGVVITDELRNLARLGRSLMNGNSE